MFSPGLVIKCGGLTCVENVVEKIPDLVESEVERFCQITRIRDKHLAKFE